MRFFRHNGILYKKYLEIIFRKDPSMKRNLFQRTRTFIKKNKMLLYIIFSYAAVSTLLISFLAFFLIRTFTAASTQNYISSYTEIVTRIADTMDLIFSNTYEVSRYLFENDEDMQKGMYASSFSSDDLVGIRTKLTKALTMDPNLYSIYLVNSQADSVFSSYPSLSSCSDFYDPDILETLFRTSDTHGVLSRRTEGAADDLALPTDFITFFHKSPNMGGQKEGGLIANISCEYLQETLATEYGRNTNLYIIDSEDKIIFSSPFTERLSSDLDENLAKHLRTAETGNHFFYPADSQENIVVFQHGSTFDFTFLCVIPYNLVLENARQVQQFVILLAVLLILAGLIIAYGFALKIYAPFYQFLKNLRKKLSKEDTEAATELDYLASTYDYLLGNVRSLSQKMEIHCLNKLLGMEYPSPEAAREDLRACGLFPGDGKFLVILFRFCDLHSLNAQYDASDLGRFKADISEAIQAMFSSFADCKCTMPDSDSIVLVLHSASFSDETVLHLEQTAKNALSSVSRRYQICLCAGISRTAAAVTDLHLAYRQAFFAADCRMYQDSDEDLSDACVIRYDQVASLDQETLTYPQGAEKALLSALKSLDASRAGQACGDFIQELRSASPEIARLYLTQLCASIAPLLQETWEDEGSLDFSTLKRELEYRETLSQKQRYLSALMERYIDHRKEHRHQKEGQITEQILEWIRTHYQDPELSLEVIAASNHYSSSYLRRIFKDCKGFSPTDYLMSYRIEKAKELLETTREPAVKICQMIGISNPKYFYSIFKKTVGCTTSDYRKKGASVWRDS